MIHVLKPGLQTTVQSRPRFGLRHRGVPSGGAADALSLALANRLVGNSWDAPALEAVLLGPTLKFAQSCCISITGGEVWATLNDTAVSCHECIPISTGDELVIGSVSSGARAYIAFSGGLDIEIVLRSASTNLQAAFGGLNGRALRSGDRLRALGRTAVEVSTPDRLRPRSTGRVALRTCEASDTNLLDQTQQKAFFGTKWQVGHRADRMGIRLSGALLDISSDGRMPSAAVFPGTIQCPEDGVPYLLSVDAGTVGGYPRIGQVARADLHVLGQLRPGDRMLLLRTDPDEAVALLREKHEYWSDWLPSIEEII